MQGNTNHTVHPILIEIAERVLRNSARLIYLSPEQIQKRSATKFDSRNLWSHLSLDVGGGVLVVWWLCGFIYPCSSYPSLSVFLPHFFIFRRVFIWHRSYLWCTFHHRQHTRRRTQSNDRLLENRAHIKSTSLLTCTFRWLVGFLLCFGALTDLSRVWANLLQTSFIFI